VKQFNKIIIVHSFTESVINEPTGRMSGPSKVLLRQLCSTGGIFFRVGPKECQSSSKNNKRLFSSLSGWPQNASSNNSNNNGMRKAVVLALASGSAAVYLGWQLFHPHGHVYALKPRRVCMSLS
jgi:hypothetical protein